MKELKANDLIGRCAERTNDLYGTFGKVIIQDVSPYGHVYIKFKSNRSNLSMWLEPDFQNNWKKCSNEIYTWDRVYDRELIGKCSNESNTWDHVYDQELIGKCVTRIKSMNGDRSFIDKSIYVKNIIGGQIKFKNATLEKEWNDMNWVVAPTSMDCIK